MHPLAVDLGHPGVDEYSHTQTLELLVRGCRELFRQRGKDSRSGLEQRDLEPTLVECLQTVLAQRAGGVVQLGRELHSGGAASDDGDLDSCIARCGCRRSTRDAQAMVQQPLPKSLRVLPLVEIHAVGTNARGTEIVRHRADRHDQVVVGDTLAGQQLGPLIVVHWRNRNLAALPVDVLRGAEEESKPRSMTVRPVPDFVEIGIERAGRDFMQQRLPDVGAMTVDEEDVDVGVAPVSAPQFRGKLQPPGPSPDDDDLRHSIRHVTPVACPGASTRRERRDRATSDENQEFTATPFGNRSGAKRLQSCVTRPMPTVSMFARTRPQSVNA